MKPQLCRPCILDQFLLLKDKKQHNYNIEVYSMPKTFVQRQSSGLSVKNTDVCNNSLALADKCMHAVDKSTKIHIRKVLLVTYN